MKIKIESIDQFSVFEDKSNLNQYVRRLDLSNLELSSIPPFVLALPFIQELTLSNNIISSIPAKISNLGGTLRGLWIDGNKLTAIPDEISTLRKLNSLDASKQKGDKISKITPLIGQCVLLRSLDFRENSLLNLPKEIGSLANLESLYLSDNLLQSLPVEMKEMKSVNTLLLQNNMFSDIPECISNMSGLTRLNLLNNPIPIPIVDAFREAVRFIETVDI